MSIVQLCDWISGNLVESSFTHSLIATGYNLVHIHTVQLNLAFTVAPPRVY